MSSIDPKAFLQRHDPADPRLGLIVRQYPRSGTNEPGWILAGYPDDEGIALNGGRRGASQAPGEIRRFLYRMTPRLESPSARALFDYGDFTADGDLGARHERVAQVVAAALKSGHRWLGLGGGHDYGYADGKGFLDSPAVSNSRPLIINFDAHLDVRPTDRGLTSGTAFRRLGEEFPDCEMAVIGIQSQCNAQPHWQWWQDRGGHTLSLEQIWASELSPAGAVARFLLPLLERRRPVYLSIDLDVFSSAFAPGCSQSWPSGLEPQTVLAALDVILARADVRVIGLYETSPPFDVDGRTSRLAAVLAHRAMFSLDRV